MADRRAALFAGDRGGRAHPDRLGLILIAMPPGRRAHSERIWAVTGSLGAAAGPAIAGLLVQASWRWIFLLNVPIGIAAFVAAALLRPAQRHSIEPECRIYSAGCC